MRKYFCLMILIIIASISLVIDIYNFLEPKTIEVEIYEIIVPIIKEAPEEKSVEEFIEEVEVETEREESVMEKESKDITAIIEENKQENNIEESEESDDVKINNNTIVTKEKEVKEVEEKVVNNMPDKNDEVISKDNNNPIYNNERPVVEDSVIVNTIQEDMSGGRTVVINKTERIWPEYDNISGTKGTCEYCGGTGVIDCDLRCWSDVNGTDHITHNKGCTEAFKNSVVESDSELNCR